MPCTAMAAAHTLAVKRHMSTRLCLHLHPAFPLPPRWLPCSRQTQTRAAPTCSSWARCSCSSSASKRTSSRPPTRPVAARSAPPCSTSARLAPAPAASVPSHQQPTPRHRCRSRQPRIKPPAPAVAAVQMRFALTRRQSTRTKSGSKTALLTSNRCRPFAPRFIPPLHSTPLFLLFVCLFSKWCVVVNQSNASQSNPIQRRSFRFAVLSLSLALSFSLLLLLLVLCL